MLCGDQPYTLDKAEGRAGVAACGVTTIVCLRTKAEMASGKNSYVSSMAKLLGKEVVKFVSFPITDQNVADDQLLAVVPVAKANLALSVNGARLELRTLPYLETDSRGNADET